MLTIILTLINPKTIQPEKVWEFHDKTVIRVGRSSDNDIVLDQFPEVSRYHLELQLSNPSQPTSEWHLTNHGTNGTFVNQKLVNQGLITNNTLIQLAKDGPILKFETKISIPQTRPNPPKSVCSHQNNPPNNLFCIHCGQPLVEKEQFIRQYQIMKTLGRGGMGTTYIAWDRDGTIKGKPILLVLKEMNADMAQIAKAQELFEREARVLKSLQHPGIPQYYDFFVENNQKYLAMELVHGQNLEDRVYSFGTITPQEAIALMIQTCDILAYLHQLTPPS
jgi:serine/threonine protein kinase, bacterial